MHVLTTMKIVFRVRSSNIIERHDRKLFDSTSLFLHHAPTPNFYSTNDAYNFSLSAAF